MGTANVSNKPASALATPWYERHWGLLAFGIVLFTVAMSLSLISSVWLASPDPVKYADLARALARGDGYLFNNGAEAKHPPGFPVLLVPLFWLTSNPLLAGRLMIILAAGASLYLAGVILRRVLGAGVSLAALVCVAASVNGWWSAQALVSEYPYAVFQNLALILFVRLAASANAPRRRDALWFGLAAGAALFIRPAAVALVAAGAYSILRRRLSGSMTNARTASLAALSVGLPLIPFGTWRAYVALYRVEAAVPENVSILWRAYASSPAELIVQTVKNLLNQGGGLVVGEFHPAQYPSIEPWLWLALLLIWVPVPVALLVRGMWRAEPVWTFLCVYLLMIALWPLSPGATARLCYPVAPFVAGLLLSSWRWLADKAYRRHGAAVVTAVIVGGVLAAQVAVGIPRWRKMQAGQDFWDQRLDDLEHIRNKFHPDATASWAHLNVRAAIYVFDMHSMMMEFSWSKDTEEWARELSDYGPDYIVVPTGPRQRENADLFVSTLKEIHPAATCAAELETISLYHIPSPAPQLSD